MWKQSLTGRAIDIRHPKAEEINFRELADEMSTVNRWAGSARKPVNLCLHSEIVFDEANDAAKPYALLHDAHETYVGERPTPAKQALEDLAFSLYDARTAKRVTEVWNTLTGLIDSAMWRAAGLPPPSPAIIAEVKRADLVALVTERRDFLEKGTRAWHPEIERIQPRKQVYRLRAPDECADRLYAKFKIWLPRLRDGFVT